MIINNIYINYHYKQYTYHIRKKKSLIWKSYYSLLVMKKCQGKVKISRLFDTKRCNYVNNVRKVLKNHKIIRPKINFQSYSIHFYQRLFYKKQTTQEFILKSIPIYK